MNLARKFRWLRGLILLDAALLLFGGSIALQQAAYWQKVSQCRSVALNERQADLYCERDPWLMVELWTDS